jgi:hypothetical protein
VTISDIEVAAGRVRVTRRLALAVEIVDVAGARPAGDGLRVGVETRRAVYAAAEAHRRGRPTVWPAIRLRDHGSGRFMLTYSGAIGQTVRIRVDDPLRRWSPRRLEVTLWTPQQVEAVDQEIPGARIRALRRVIRVGLLPGQAYPTPGTTGATVLVTHQGVPVRWPRVEAFTTAGRVGWGHGDEHGQVSISAFHHEGIPPDEPVGFPVALRAHIADPDPQPLPPPRPPGEPQLPLDDRLHDLPLEVTVLADEPANPTHPPDLDTDVALGVNVPDGYLTGPDQVEPFTVGAIVRRHIEVPSP